MEKHLLKVSKTHKGTKLVHYLNDQFSLGTSEIKRLLEKRHCFINGKLETFASYRLQGDENITFSLPATETEQKLRVDFNSILYEDSTFIIYNKPAGYPSAPTEDPKRINLYQLLNQSLRKRDGTSIWMVHRLDRDTSGVILFVKQASLVEMVSDLFRHRKIQKSYEALVDGILKPAHGKIVSYLELKEKDKGWERWGSTTGHGKYAETDYQVLQYWEKACHLRLFPKTGRIHQIRVHLSEKTHPILGDSFYGKHFRCALNPPRHLLHAKSISFEHPLTHQAIQVESPLPQDFEKMIQTLSHGSPQK